VSEKKRIQWKLEEREAYNNERHQTATWPKSSAQRAPKKISKTSSVEAPRENAAPQKGPGRGSELTAKQKKRNSCGTDGAQLAGRGRQ